MGKTASEIVETLRLFDWHCEKDAVLLIESMQTQLAARPTGPTADELCEAVNAVINALHYSCGMKPSDYYSGLCATNMPIQEAIRAAFAEAETPPTPEREES